MFILYKLRFNQIGLPTNDKCQIIAIAQQYKMWTDSLVLKIVTYSL